MFRGFIAVMVACIIMLPCMGWSSYLVKRTKNYFLFTLAYLPVGIILSLLALMAMFAIVPEARVGSSLPGYVIIDFSVFLFGGIAVIRDMRKENRKRRESEQYLNKLDLGRPDK